MSYENKSIKGKKTGFRPEKKNKSKNFEVRKGILALFKCPFCEAKKLRENDFSYSQESAIKCDACGKRMSVEAIIKKKHEDVKQACCDAFSKNKLKLVLEQEELAKQKI